MGAASYLQTSFLGGEWSKYSQGRADKETYRQALNVCRNALPIEEGAWTRRSGFWHAAPTRKGVVGRVLSVEFTQTQPYNIELTSGHMRFYSGNELVVEQIFHAVTGVTTATPAVITSADKHGYATNDEVQFFFPNGINGVPRLNLALLMNRQFEITVVDDYNFSVHDPITGVGLDGALVTLDGITVTVSRVLDIVTPWTGTQIQDVRITQDEDYALMMHPAVPTQTLTITAVPSLITGAPAGFSLAPTFFQDGPYLDPPTDGSTLTPSALSGLVTLTVGYNNWSSGTTYAMGDIVLYDSIVYQSLADANLNEEPDTSGAFWSAQTANQVSINGGQGFLATDVGRQVRLFSEPLAWNSATAYAIGATVKYAGVYWSAITASTNDEPDVSINNWAISVTAAQWAWGQIVTVADAADVTVQLQTPVLYTNAIETYQIGVWGNTLGFPSNGTYYEGRFWLAADGIGNRLDSTMANNGTIMSPTGADGTVADDNGISAVLQATDVNTINWLLAADSGLVVGTQAGEWSVQASALADPITPTSIQAHRRTKFGCADVLAVHLPMAIAFVQRNSRKVIEYLADVWTGKFMGTNLSLTGKHLSAPGIVELAYQNELAPVIWARCADGSLIGCTYKRESPMGSQPANFVGWHRHDQGDNRTCVSLAGGPAVGGNLDTITMVTLDATSGIYFVEVAATLFEEDTPILQANFLDDSIIGSYADVVFTDSVATGVRFYGFYDLYAYDTDQVVSAFVGGLDCGDYAPDSYGSITVPFGSDPDKLFTLAYMAELTGDASTFTGFASTVLSYEVQGPTLPNLADIGVFQHGGGTTAGIAVDFDANFLVLLDASGATFYRQNLTTQGVQASTTFATATGGGNPSGLAGDPIMTIPDDGNLYYPVYDSNSTPLAQIPGTLGEYSKAFGNPAAGGSSNVETTPGFLASPRYGGTLYLEGKPWPIYYTPEGGSKLDVFRTDKSTLVWMDEQPGLGPATVVQISARGPTATSRGFSSGTAFLLAGSIGNTGATTYQTTELWSYTVNTTMANAAPTFPNTKADLKLVASLTPGQLNSTFTNVAGVSGIIYDETDGNLLILVSVAVPVTWASSGTYPTLDVIRGSDGHDYWNSSGGSLTNVNPVGDAGVHWTSLGTPTYTAGTYAVKLNAATGAAMWSVLVPGMPNDADITMLNTRVRLGLFGFICGSLPAQWTAVDTIAGTMTATNIEGVQAFGPSMFDDKSGNLVLLVNGYSPTTPGAPAPMGYTPTMGFSSEYAAFVGAPPVEPTYYEIPAVFGYTYDSQGQLLRPLIPQETGARDGPALGKTRRVAQFACLMANTQGISFGVDFAASLHKANFQSPGGIDYTHATLWNGVYWDKLEDDYTFDSMPSWQITRPYPATVLSYEAFVHTQDR